MTSRHLVPSFGLAFMVLFAVGCATTDFPGPIVQPDKVVLSARQLHEGLESRKTRFDAARNALELDARVFTFGEERQGSMTTDIVDLGARSGLMGQETEVQSVEIKVAGHAPNGAAIEVQVRTGDHYFDQSRWSEWTALSGLEGTVANPAGRYIQARVVLRSNAADSLPSVTSLTFKPESVIPDGPRWQQLRIVDAAVQNIVRSPIEFHYERPDHPKLTRFREAAKLDAVVAGAKDDFDALVKLMDWTGSCANVRGQKRHRQEGFYAWDIDSVFEIKDGKSYIHGHCMSYASVLVTAATSLGYVGARHWVIEGFREATHEIAEIWVPSLGKWVYFDPSLSNYYYDKASGQPLNVLELHKIVSDNFVPNGKDMHWWTERKSEETRAVVRRVGGKKPVGGRIGAWHYGKPMDPNYDWGWLHGYLAVGFAQMTPRNDFHSNPDKVSRHFGHAPGYDGYPFWVDAKTPPTKGGHNWFTRRRDFYWTLDQASFRLVRSAGGGTLFVDFGNSMPHFSRYRIKVDGVEVERIGRRYEWQMKAGLNTLEVVPEDAFGKIGQGSIIAIFCSR